MESYSEAELAEYGNCLELKYTGGHSAGLASCPYCAQIYRRYHEIAKPTTTNQQEVDVCECCLGQPTNCQTPGCSELGLCMTCSVGDI